VIARNLGRVSITAMTAVLLLIAAARTGVSAQQPPQGPPQGAQQPPGPGGGRGGPQPPKNIQVLKDVPVDQLMLTMQYIAASLGVQCTYCHVQGQNDLDDKDTKKRAREMMKMVQDINGKFFDGTQRLSCASCHNGRPKPLRTPPLAVDMTPAEAAVAAAGRGRGGRGGPGGPGGPGGGGAPGSPAAGGAPAAEGRGGPGRGAAPQEPPAPTETVDEVIAKYLQALGGEQALQNARTRVMTGTVTSRDLVTSNLTVQEKSTGEYRIDIATQPIPTIRAFNGKAAWAVGGGGGGRGGGGGGAAPDAPRDLAGFQMQQGLRLADFTLPLRVKDRYTNLLVNKAYETIDTKPVVVITGRAAPNVTEQLSFDRATGLLLRRLVITTGERLMNLPEQIDYSDYRDVNGVKVPFTVRHATWNAVTTEKFADVKINAPVDDAVFAKPAPKPPQ
jgi:photosynthetic reaction center cytochrome c subunit